MRHTNIPASYLTLLKDEKMLLLRRYNTGYEDGKYSMIAGHVDPGETFTDCVIREAQEEAGIVIHPDDVQVAHVMHRNSQTEKNSERIDVFFTATEWDGEVVNKEPHKCDDLSWFDVNAMPENILPYVRQAIRHIADDVQYSEHGW